MSKKHAFCEQKLRDKDKEIETLQQANRALLTAAISQAERSRVVDEHCRAILEKDKVSEKKKEQNTE